MTLSEQNTKKVFEYLDREGSDFFIFNVQKLVQAGVVNQSDACVIVHRWMSDRGMLN